MEMKIIRRTAGKHAVEGRLYIGGEYVCDTLEHPALHIPPGVYPLKIRKAPGRRPPRICLPARLGEIRTGTGALHLTRGGGIVVGRKHLEGVVLRSAESYGRIVKILTGGNRKKQQWRLAVS